MQTAQVWIRRIGIDAIQQTVLERVQAVDRDRRPVERVGDVDDRVVARRELCGRRLRHVVGDASVPRPTDRDTLYDLVLDGSGVLPIVLAPDIGVRVTL